ncbi:MAG: phospholipase D-like domain-containing protein [Polyangiales bacterium]
MRHAVRRWRERLRRVPRTGKSTHNSVRLLHDGAQALPAMLAAIASAKEEVLLEMYWFGSDKTGRSFAAALIERARAGVCVRVIYDALGSIEAGVAMFDEMQANGVEVFEFNPIAPWRRHFRFARINNRDHRKLLVIDGQLAITGGFNLGDPWAPRDQGGQGWRDDGVEVHGSAALSMRALFYRTFPAKPLALSPKLVNEGETEVTVLASEFHAERRDIYDGYINAIARATRDIIITNSYFIPARRVRHALARAVSRDVRVRVLMPRDTDVKLAQLASRHLYTRLLKDGIELYEWGGGILHSKTAVIDDHWSTVGSFNFDARSIYNNLELNVAMVCKEVNTALRKRVEADLQQSMKIELAHWKKRSLFLRMIERFVYAFRWLL